jgi:type IX secretion system PorP/SprF family membrane protein
MKKILLLISNCAFLMLYTAQAQDPHFSQFYANAIYTNPAFAGTSDHTRISLNGRKQFTNVPAPMYTTTASADMKLSGNGGLGFTCLYDKAGSSALTTTGASMIYAHRVAVNRKVTISAAIQAGFVNRNIDRSNLVFADQLETEQGKVRNTAERLDNPQRFYPNFSAGFTVYTKDFFSGVAIHNIAEPNQSFINTSSRDQQYLHQRRYTVHMGMNLYTHRNIRKATVISPNILCMMQGEASEVNLGFYARKDKLTTGLWMRQTMNNSDAVILMAGYRFEKMTIGYSYDLGVGRSYGNIKSAHEISLQLAIEKQRYSRGTIKHKKMPCPDL